MPDPVSARRIVAVLPERSRANLAKSLAAVMREQTLYRQLLAATLLTLGLDPDDPTVMFDVDTGVITAPPTESPSPPLSIADPEE